MSAVPLTRVREQDRRLKDRPADQGRRKSTGKSRQSRAKTKAKAKVVAKKRSSTISFFFQQVFWCAFVIAVTYGFSILLGSSMMENARRDKVRAVSRMKEARADMVQVRSRMDRLTTMAAVDTWARSRGFVPPHGLTIEMDEILPEETGGVAATAGQVVAAEEPEAEPEATPVEENVTDRGEGASGLVADTSGDSEDGA